VVWEAVTRARTLSRTGALLLSTRDTVDGDTLAWRATSDRLGRFVLTFMN
jgi:hypothetical protein